MERSKVHTVSLQQFVKALHAFHADKITGCLFFTSKENKSGRIFLKDGEIINLGYAGKAGNKAIEQMFLITVLKYRLDFMEINITRDERLPHTADIINGLAELAALYTSLALNKTDDPSTAAEAPLPKIIAPIETTLVTEEAPASDTTVESTPSIIAPPPTKVLPIPQITEAPSQKPAPSESAPKPPPPPAAALLSERKKAKIMECLIDVIGPMAELVGEEPIENAHSIDDIIEGLREDLDGQSLQEFEAAVHKLQL